MNAIQDTKNLNNEKENTAPENVDAVAAQRKKERFIAAIQPDEGKRHLIINAYNAFKDANSEAMHNNISEANKKHIFYTALRLGIPLSDETIYLHIQTFGHKSVLTLQDNYLFLQKIVLDHTKAQAMSINVLYVKEIEYLKANNIGSFDVKEDVIPIYELESVCAMEQVAFVQMSLVFNNGEHRYKTVFSKEKLIERAGTAANRGMWRNASNHVKIELLKKTAIRAFAKEKFGGTLEIIRSIDIAEQQTIERFGTE